jgi:chloramphenicol O-acetyltransferase type A
MKEINPLETNRSASWQLFSKAPMPMVTIFKTMDITNLVKMKAQGYKLNMLLCYCIVWAAHEMPEFRLLPVDEKMIQYDAVGVDVIVANKNGGLNSCDIPFTAGLAEFNDAYLQLTKNVYQQCENHELKDCMMIGTSSLIKYEIDGVINMYSGIFNNPFMIWGKYRTEQESVKLQVSFQFHHVQLDGLEACSFLEKVQKNIFVITGSNMADLSVPFSNIDQK